MSQRMFTDREGVRWKVSVVEPDHESGTRERRSEPRLRAKAKGTSARLATRPVSVPLLRFESKTSQRQLTPIPEGWELMDDAELEDLIADSVLVTPL